MERLHANDSYSQDLSKNVSAASRRFQAEPETVPGSAARPRRTPMFYRSRIRFRRFMRKLINRDDPPERVARGLAAGVFAATIPLPGLQIMLS